LAFGRLDRQQLAAEGISPDYTSLTRVDEALPEQRRESVLCGLSASLPAALKQLEAGHLHNFVRRLAEGYLSIGHFSQSPSTPKIPFWGSRFNREKSNVAKYLKLLRNQGSWEGTRIEHM
jgi:hypothetical protein